MKAQTNMLVYSTDWYGRRTFRMLPLTQDCPFNEVIFDPSTKVLAVISKEFKEKPHMFPKLNNAGLPLNGTGANSNVLEERLVMDSYYEYYIDNINDIKRFVEYFALNSDHEALSIIDDIDALL
jgi:hypothetical protein